MSLLSALALRGKYKVSVAYPMGLMLASTCDPKLACPTGHSHSIAPQMKRWTHVPWGAPIRTTFWAQLILWGQSPPHLFPGHHVEWKSCCSSLLPWTLILILVSLTSTCPPQTLLFSLRNSDLLTYELFSVSSLTLFFLILIQAYTPCFSSCLGGRGILLHSQPWRAGVDLLLASWCCHKTEVLSKPWCSKA